MKTAWLAIDTAAPLASVAVLPPTPTARARATVIRGAREQAARIIPAVDDALQRAGTRLDDLAGIVVGDGPGSFTGLRIGWAAAKGLAHERDIPLFTAPSLMGLAWVAWHTEGAGAPAVVAACYDALRGEVYGALYEISGDHIATLMTPAVLTLAEFARRAPVRPQVAVGDGARRYAEAVTQWTGRAPLADEPGAGRAARATVAEGLVAFTRYDSALRRIAEPLSAEPVYGRPAAAQARWEASHGRPLPDPPRSQS
ncbi:MAG TPA: tRNA (adenosine(37)-N6)-threonylcarbamoyltransferase complex dimerization subunit type 1 TsaB [Gemmatimonadales bacterium]|nr:tRNA (adenosine(37)-N6)-threonylcarbamoyltransferase complex dimerization subunit type 1 TsaB [Gemmatimonadales bacterium]